MRHLLVVLILLISATGATAAAGQKKTDTTLYYLDFTGATFSPVTKQDIKSASRKIVGIRPNDEQLLFRLIAEVGSRGRFDNKNVRLLVQKSGASAPIYVDGGGHVLRGRQQYTMTPINFLLLEQLLMGLVHPDTPTKTVLHESR